MSRRSLQADTAPCPLCGSENLSYVAFCISCGESFDDLSPSSQVSQGLAPLPTSPNTARASVASWSALRRRETWLGALLLIALLSYVVYEWGRSTAQSAAYREGLAAVQRKDWDQALAQFEQASDWRDASSQARVARNRIIERDELYRKAVDAAAGEQWSTAVAALQSLELVQPGYRDSEQRLDAAQEAAFRKGLAGLVYLVSSGEKPGLYLRDGSDSPRYLPGSDRYSLLRASSEDGLRLAYDVPAAALATLPLVGDAGPASPGGARRVPILAHLSSDGPAGFQAALGLDPDGSGTFVEGGGPGIWWRNSTSSRQSPGEVFYFGPEPGALHPVSDSGLTGTYKLVQLSDLQKGKRVVAFDAQRGRVVWVQAAAPGVNSMRGTLVFISGSAGQEPRYLMPLGGDVTRASISRDGRWLLLTSQTNNNRISQSAWIMQITSPRSYVRPRVLENISWGDSLVGGRLTATFVPGNEPNGAVLVRSILGDNEKLTLYDPARRDAKYELSRQPEGVFRPDKTGIAHNGDFLAARRQLQTGAVLELVKMPPAGGLPFEVRLPVYTTQNADAQFSPRDDYVLVTVHNPDGIDRSTAQVVYAARVEPDGTLGDARLLAISSMPFDPATPTTALPGDGTLFAYISSQQLKTVSLDGSSLRNVATGVSAVWSLGQRSDLQWWR